MDGLPPMALDSPALALAGRFVLHALWQGIALALLYAAALAGPAVRPPAHRADLGLVTLVAMVVLPAITALVSGIGGSAPGGTSWLIAAPSAVAGGAPTLLQAAGATWLAGVAILGLRWLRDLRRVSGLTRRGTGAVPPAWVSAAERLAARMGVGRAVAVLGSARVDGPTLVGWVRPVILLPASALSGLEPRLIEALLAHELAHVRRHDVLLNHLQTGAETLLFFHPAARWVGARIREERELACDALAADVTGDPAVLARALADLEQLRPRPAAVALAATGGTLLVRVRRLLGHTPAARPGRAAALAALAPVPLVLALALVFACSSAGPVPIGDGAGAGPSVGAAEADAPSPAGPAPSDPYRYDPHGKRDPYRAWDATVIDPPARWAGTPAQEWELDQLQMVGIVRDAGAPQVMLEDPRGQGHLLRVGDYVGKRRGQITAIHGREMTVTEWLLDADHGKVPLDRTLGLPDPG